MGRPVHSSSAPLPLPSDLEQAILRAYEATRTRGRPAGAVAARPNRRRLASLTRPAAGPTTLNLALAVVEAGEPAWRLVAPALEGDRRALARLRELTRDGLVEARRRRPGRRSAGRDRAGARHGLPETPCDGTPEERRFLLTLVRCVRETSGHADALPKDVQVRISRRMTRALGTCRWIGRSRRITLAARLFRPGLEDVLWETVKHEMAHLADQVTSRHVTSSHGVTWKAWARRLGASPERLCTPEDARRILAAGERGRGRALAYPPEVARWLRNGKGG